MANFEIKEEIGQFHFPLSNIKSEIQTVCDMKEEPNEIDDQASNYSESYAGNIKDEIDHNDKTYANEESQPQTVCDMKKEPNETDDHASNYSESYAGNIKDEIDHNDKTYANEESQPQVIELFFGNIFKINLFCNLM
ncbi:hypothetical protein C0J52_15486 [Blattella germanica]|nr:hypothetical protein C0J52_15486 [Blattella germanica]